MVPRSPSTAAANFNLKLKRVVMKRFLVLVALGVLASCSAEDDLVGEWETPGGEMALRFAEDGTFHTSAPGGEVLGTYRPAEDGLVEMEFDGMSERFVTEVSGDQLTFCQENYGCERFRRVR
jgi:hypothetical protein